MQKIKKMLILAISLVVMCACSPEVGSQRWCKQMKEKPKGEWTANETVEYGRSCIIL